MKIKELSTAEGYNQWAPIYEHNENPLMALDEIAFKENVEPVLEDEKIADLGCGTGRFSVMLSALGAEVTGVDASKGMLEIAKTKTSNSISFIQHDLSKPLPLENNYFDKVISTLVLEHIPDLLLFFNEIKRICKPQGSIYISGMHPAMMLKGNRANFTDPLTGEEVRPKGYDHQLSDFVINISKAGLEIEGMKEYNGNQELAKQFPKAEKYLHWPMLVIFKLKAK